MLTLFFKLVQREFFLRWRNKYQTLLPGFFFLLISCLFPLAITPDPNLLKMIAAGVIWVSVLLSIFMSLPQLFEQDYRDGSLDQLLLLNIPISWVVAAKCFVHWLALIIPLLIIIPVISSMYTLSFHVTIMMLLSLILAMPTLILLGALLSALTLGMRQQGLLLALLLFPLYIPVLIFSTGLLSASVSSVHAACALLGAIFLINMVALPVATASLLSLSVR